VNLIPVNLLNPSEATMRPIPDGYDVHRFKEFQDLLFKFRSIGVPVYGCSGEHLVEFKLTIYLQEAELEVKNFGCNPVVTQLPISGADVYRWPEIKALCDRLGVYHGASTNNMILMINEGECPTVIHEYCFHDTNPTSQETYQPVEIRPDSDTGSPQGIFVVAEGTVEGVTA